VWGAPPPLDPMMSNSPLPRMLLHGARLHLTEFVMEESVEEDSDEDMVFLEEQEGPTHRWRGGGGEARGRAAGTGEGAVWRKQGTMMIAMRTKVTALVKEGVRRRSREGDTVGHREGSRFFHVEEDTALRPKPPECLTRAILVAVHYPEPPECLTGVALAAVHYPSNGRNDFC
jgi:hypothetical protein